MASSTDNNNNNSSKRFSSRQQTANTKKILEVKEVIQNRTNNEIQIVLDYYNNDVGKAITAFLNDEAKDILSRKKIIKTKNTDNNESKRQQQQQQQPKTTNNNASFNVNSLVESIISKYTKTNEEETVIISPKNIEINLNSTSSINSLNETRPNSLDLIVNKKEDEEVKNLDPTTTTTKTETNKVINVNAKKILEKSHKDLQRQIVSLSKLTVNFDEEIDKTQNILKDLFGKLRDLVNEREIELKNELEKLKTHGNELFTNRQKKANEFKIASDNADHLSDAQVQELKADIKNFVSERKLDEELGMTKRFHHDYDKVELTIKTFGQLVKIKENHYETNGLLSEITTPTSIIVTMPLNQQQPVTLTISEEFDKKLIINNDKPQQNSSTAVVEAKKPQRNRNRNTNNNNCENNQNPTKINGHNYNDRPINNNTNKRPQTTQRHVNNGQIINGGHIINGNNKLNSFHSTNGVTNGDNKNKAAKLNEN